MSRIAIVLLFLSFLSQTWSLTQIPYFVGVKLCHLLCQASGHCTVDSYHRESLTCFTSIGKTIPGTDGNGMNKLCGKQRCPPNFRCLTNRRQDYVCVSSSIRTVSEKEAVSQDSYRVIVTSKRNMFQKHFFAVDVHRNKMQSILAVSAKRITVLKAYGTNIFWCQRRRDYCGHARFSLYGAAQVVTKGANIKWTDLTVDIKRSVIYGALDNVIMKYSSDTWKSLRMAFTVSWKLFMIELDPEREYIYAANTQNRQIEIYSTNGSKIMIFGVFTNPCQHLYLDVRGNTLYSSQYRFVEYLPLDLPLNLKKMGKLGIRRHTSATSACADNGMMIIRRDRALIEWRVDRPWTKDKGHMINMKTTVALNTLTALVKFTEFKRGRLTVQITNNSRGKAAKQKKKKRHHPESMIISVMKPRNNFLLTTIYSKGLLSGKLTPRHTFVGRLISLAIEKNLMFRCQLKPQAIFQSTFDPKTGKPTDIMIGADRCIAITLDSKKKVVFLLKEVDDYLYRFNIAKTPKGIRRVQSVKVPRTVGTDTNIFIDKAFHNVYAYTSGDFKVTGYTYSGRPLPPKNLSTPAQHLVYTSDQRLYFTTMFPTGVLGLGKFGPESTRVKILNRVLLAQVTGFALTKSFIITANDRNYDVFLRKGMKKKDRGRFRWKQCQLHSLDHW